VDVHCSECGGKGQTLTTEHVSITIPSGIDEQTTLRLQGKGLPGLNGGESGDLYISVHILQHPHFRRQGKDIYTEEPVSYLDALLGTELNLETIEGRQKVQVKPLTQHGARIKLDGAGVKVNNTKGDHYVSINLRLPEQLTDQERSILEQLRGIK
jgi:molecular chaperone DnaJ